MDTQNEPEALIVELEEKIAKVNGLIFYHRQMAKEYAKDKRDLEKAIITVNNLHLATGDSDNEET